MLERQLDIGRIGRFIFRRKERFRFSTGHGIVDCIVYNLNFGNRAGRKNCTIISRHADLTLPGYVTYSPGSFAPEIASQVITLMAPSKTFNIPGLSSSFYHIQNDRIRKQFKGYLDKAELGDGTIFSIVAAQAAYEKGDVWLDQLLTYLQGNGRIVDEYLKANIPVIKACLPQASFLIWLDCREMGLNPQALHQFFIREAKLGLNPGYSFGAGGEGFMRMNIGCPAETVRLAMHQLNQAVTARFS